MKITADNLLGGARRINQQRESAQSAKEKGSAERLDRADIVRKADTRLESIGGEMRDVQTQLSEKQMIKEGLDRVSDALNKGDQAKLLLEETTFNGKKVLLDFLGGNGDKLTMQILSAKNKELDATIAADTSRLSRLQVESENILASNLPSAGKAGEMAASANRMIQEKGFHPQMSSLHPEAVMRLIR